VAPASRNRWAWVCLGLPPAACALSLGVTRLAWEWARSGTAGTWIGVLHAGVALLDLGNMVLCFVLLWHHHGSGTRAIFNRELLAGLLSLGFALFHFVMGSLAVAQIR
jgi:hypothetical protein